MTACFLLLLLMTFLGAAAALFLKKAASAGGGPAVLKNANFYTGGFLYFVSAVLNIIVLRRMDYSMVLPLTSITYIWTMIISYAVLKEKMTLRKICGVALIVIGAVCISL